jgi:hypothetical protein
MSVEFIAYKGYELAVTRDVRGWQVVIQPMSAKLPTRPRFLPIIVKPDRHGALEDAKRAVDELLAKESASALSGAARSWRRS